MNVLRFLRFHFAGDRRRARICLLVVTAALILM